MIRAHCIEAAAGDFVFYFGQHFQTLGLCLYTYFSFSFVSVFVSSWNVILFDNVIKQQRRNFHRPLTEFLQLWESKRFILFSFSIYLTDSFNRIVWIEKQSMFTQISRFVDVNRLWPTKFICLQHLKSYQGIYRHWR